MTVEQLNKEYISLMLKKLNGEAEHDLEVVKEHYYNIQNDYLEIAETALEGHIFQLYDQIFFGKRKIDKAVQEQGEAAYQKAVELIREKDYDRAGKLFREAALCGHVAGQYDFGVSVMNGEGCEKDELQGCYWYWKASNEEHTNAMINLAINYRNGIGVRENGWKMIHMYARAAYLLNPYAVYNLGLSLKKEEVIIGQARLGRILIQLSEELEDEKAVEVVRSVSLNIMGIVRKRMELGNEPKVRIDSEKMMDLSSDFYLLPEKDKKYVKQYFSSLMYDLAAVLVDCERQDGIIDKSKRQYMISTYAHINTLLLFMALHSAPAEEATESERADVVILIVDSYLDAIGKDDFYDRLANFTEITDYEFRKECVRRYGENIENTLLSVRKDYSDFLCE